MSGIALRQLVREIDRELVSDRFADYCPNGLQVEGRAVVSRLVTGVTASLELIHAAIEREADAILVHHGYFWRGESPVISGMKLRRLQCLLENRISLLAYHLPLDAHPVLGNNAQLARLLDFVVEGPFRDDGVGLIGSPSRIMAAEEMAQHLDRLLGRRPVWVSAGSRPIHRVAWCTGAAQSFLLEAANAGADAYISGEISEQTTHEARENGIHYFAAGHHATERFGVRALGDWCAARLGIEHQFVDIFNPA